jgi:hypothetical protein
MLRAAQSRSSPLPALALLLAILLPAVSVGPTEAKLLRTWTFAQQRSDDLPQKIAATVRPDYVATEKSSRRGCGSELARGSRAPGQAHPHDRQTDEFKSGLGDEVNIYRFGREAAAKPAGTLKVTVAWQGEQIVTEERQTKGKGRIKAVYTLQPGGRSLQVDWRLEHESMRQPLEVRLAFDRAR